MASFSFRIAILLLILSILQIGRAEAKPEKTLTLSLEEVLQRSLKFHPEIKKVDAALAEKLAQATQVQLPENLEVRFKAGAQDAPFGSDRNRYEVEVEQPIRLSHFGIRQAYASVLKHAARLEQQAEVIRVLNETTLLYYRVWMLEKREQMLKNSEKQAQEVLERIQQSLKNKEAPLTETSLFQVEAVRFSTELQVTRAERKLAQFELLRAAGLPWSNIELEAPKLKTIPSNLFKLQSFAQNRSGLRELVLQKQQAAQRRYDVARADIFPELSPYFAYESADRSNEEEWRVGVAVRVPIWDWNQAELKRAKAQKEAADAETQGFDRVTFDRVLEVRQARAVAFQKRADIYWKNILPTYQKNYEFARKGFENGEVTTFQLWQFQQKVSDIYEQALQNIASALAARTALEQALGGKIEEIP